MPLDSVRKTTPSVLRALINGRRPARRSALSALAWEIEAPLARLVQHGPPPGPRKLNLGCGDVRPDGWLNADFATARWVIQRRQWPQWSFDATRRWPCPDDYFDAIHCEHVLEHFPYADGIAMLEQCLRTLRPGGVLRLSVPDVAKFVDAYVRQQAGEMPAEGFRSLGPGAMAISQLTQCDGHLSVWDASTMKQALLEIGFAIANECSFGESAIEDVIDRSDRAWQSCYVEATK
jgi:predicted SAM-dependent methyltransferase